MELEKPDGKCSVQSGGVFAVCLWGFQFLVSCLIMTNVDIETSMLNKEKFSTTSATFSSLEARWWDNCYIYSSSKPILASFAFCLQCIPSSKVHKNISRGHDGTELMESRSYTGPLVEHGVFAVLQTQASFFEVH